MAEHSGQDINFDAVDGLMETEAKLKKMKSIYIKHPSNYIPADPISSFINAISIFAVLVVIGVGIFHSEYFILIPIILILDRLLIYNRKRIRSKKFKEYLEWKERKGTQQDEILGI